MTLAKDALIRAVIIDDSLTTRELILSLLQKSKDVIIAGYGETGEDAVRLVKRYKPDVLVMGINLRKGDGFTATRQIMRESPLPIILTASRVTPNNENITYQALNAGALTVITKPDATDAESCTQLVKNVRVMAGLPVVHHWGHNRPTPPAAAPAARQPQTRLPSPRGDQFKIIGIASSTGGPGALGKLFSPLPANYPWPILVVQHITSGFGPGLVKWIGSQTALSVKLAEQGELPRPGTIYFAPDDLHMQVDRKRTIDLTKDPQQNGLCPSANPMFQSLAAAYKSAALGIILTGMGSDGVEGLSELYRAGGYTVAQNEASCVVYGMPRAAVEKQIINQIFSIDEISHYLIHLQDGYS